MLLAENLLRWLNQIVMPALDRGVRMFTAGVGGGLRVFSAGEERQCVAAMDYRQNMPDARGIVAHLGQLRVVFSGRDITVIAAPVGPGPVRRAWATALAMTTVAGIIALCLSAMANRSLLRQVSDDLHKYAITPMADTVVKSRYLSVLKEDAQRLDDYYREGEPLRLGLGLYPGERLRQPVLQAIRAYRPPELKTESVPGGAVQTVRLDSMALFDVGQARLKIGSTKVLVEALVNIKAKPGWLILVAGYTDSTGDEKSNQQLSLRRAEAVRDWMLQTSDIPFTCFAVQGLGESQPAATNDTPEGRATNRRVEISLVPRSDACQDVKQQIPPELAVSQFNQQGE
jgi:outer membrane protein OmpA-like peptidoglycan-associated protein